MEQKYKIEFDVSINPYIRVLDQKIHDKEYYYLQGCKYLLDKGITRFTATFTLLDPRTMKCKTDHEYTLRDNLIKEGKLRMQWEWRFVEYNKHIVHNIKNAELVVLQTWSGSLSIIDTVHYSDNVDYIYKLETLKLFHGNIKIYQNDGTIGEIQYTPLKP